MSDMIDANVPRFNQACVAGLTGLAFVFQYWPLIAVIAGVLAVSRFAGPRYAAFTQIYLRLIKPRLGDVPKEPAGPPKFAQLLGVVVLTAAVLAFLVGFDAIGWVLTLVVTALATLAAVTKICAGCVIYEKAIDRA